MTTKIKFDQERVTREHLAHVSKITIDACIMVLRQSIQNLEQLKAGIDTDNADLT